MPLWLHDKFRKRQKEPALSISAADSVPPPDPPMPCDIYGLEPIVAPRGYELGEFARLKANPFLSGPTECVWMDENREPRGFVRPVVEEGLWRYRLVNKYPDACCAECGADKAELIDSIAALEIRVAALEAARSKEHH